MTDPTPRPDDELVSAVLDGEATADERAQVEGDPAARARLAELAAVRDRVAAPVTVPADARERALAAALAAFDAPNVTADGPAPDPQQRAKDELAARRARRSSSGGRFLAAAAAVVVVLFGIGVVLRALNPGAQETVATSADQSKPPSAAGGSGAESGDLSEQNGSVDAAPTTTVSTLGDGAATTVPPAAPEPVFTASVVGVDLGTVASVRDLRDQMLGVIDGRAAAGSDAPAPTVPPASLSFETAQLASCASFLDAVDVELDELLAVGTATLDGRAVLVYAFRVDKASYPAANGSVRIYAVDPTTCATVSVQTTR